MIDAADRIPSCLRRAHHHHLAALELDLHPLMLTALQAQILMHLEEYRDFTMAQLARVSAVSPQTIQGAIHVMERRGLLVRRPAAHDRKAKRLELTDHGASLGRSATAVVDRERIELRAEFTEYELDTLLALLRRLSEHYSRRRFSTDGR